jgi:hypothetical protein
MRETIVIASGCEAIQTARVGQGPTPQASGQRVDCFVGFASSQ